MTSFVLQLVVRRSSSTRCIFKCLHQHKGFSHKTLPVRTGLVTCLDRFKNSLAIPMHVRTAKSFRFGGEVDTEGQLEYLRYRKHVLIDKRGINLTLPCVNGCRYTSLVRHSQIRYFTEDKQTKTLTIWQDLRQIRSSPLPALVFGIFGLAPFVGFPGYMVLAQAYIPSLAFAQVVYGATILSFLGGIRWGITVPEESLSRPDWSNLGYSVAPPLIAWAGLLLPDPLSLFTIMTGLIGTAYSGAKEWSYPSWFKGLQFILSFVAVLSLWTTFICGYSLKSSQIGEIITSPNESKGL